MVRKLAAAMVATFGLLGVLAIPAPVAAQSDAETTATTEGDSTTAPSTDTSAASNSTSEADSEPAADAEPETASATVIAKRGDRGSAVRELQTRLARAGFSPGVIDGIFGRLTEGAVVSFQKAAGLSATGVYDSETAAKLASYTPNTSPAIMSTREAQQRLTDAGFDPGPIDGLYGRRTRAGLEAFQRHVGIAVTGRVDAATSEALRNYDAGSPPTPSPAIMSTREAQQRLTDAGFDPGPIDGLYGRRTRAGLEAFQRHVGIPVTGRVDAATSEALRNYDAGSPPTPPPTDPDDGTVDSLREAQRALADGPFDPGPIDGTYGTMTKNAIWALEKLTGITMNGQWGADDEAALKRVLNGSVGGPTTSRTRRWVEIDLSQQLMKVYDPGRTMPVLVSHISTGNGIPWRLGPYSGRSITPVGSFTIFRRISGWHQSSLGLGGMYNPLYFTGGIALHGSRSVPSYPASHGCVRVPMHIAEYLPGMLPNGTPVIVMR